MLPAPAAPALCKPIFFIRLIAVTALTAFLNACFRNSTLVTDR